MKIFAALIFGCACSVVHAQQSEPAEAVKSVRLQLPKNDIYSTLSMSAALVDLEDVHTSFSNRGNIRSNGEVILKLQDPLHPPDIARLHLYVPGGVGLGLIYSKPIVLAGSKRDPADVIHVELKVPGIVKLELFLPFEQMNEEQRAWLVEGSEPLFHYIRSVGSPQASMQPSPRFQVKHLNFGPPWKPHYGNATKWAPVLPSRYFSIEKTEEEFHIRAGPMATGKWFVWLSGSSGWRTPPIEINVQPNQDKEWVLPSPMQEEKWHIQFPNELANPVFRCLVWERIGSEPLVDKFAELDDEQPTAPWTYLGKNCKQLFVMQDVGGFGRGTKRIYFWNLQMDEVKRDLDPKQDLHPCLDLREMVPEISYKLPAVDGENFCWLDIHRLGSMDQMHPSFPREGIAVLVLAENLAIELYGLPAGQYRITRTKAEEPYNQLDSVVVEIQ
ncbi:MAG: hypothetical protein HQ519_08580 [Planctomycetes bacterium]|nr:hypothetical protein [Planctomycetota bacterium]